MKPTKCAGIYMDHASANIIDFSAEMAGEKTVDSQFTHVVKEDTLKKSEVLMHHKEQHEEGAYYKKLGEAIKMYNDVLLFGPTEAKHELYNTIKDDHHFKDIKLHVKQSDKLTENQQHAFVKDFYVKHKI